MSKSSKNPGINLKFQVGEKLLIYFQDITEPGYENQTYLHLKKDIGVIRYMDFLTRSAPNSPQMNDVEILEDETIRITCPKYNHTVASYYNRVGSFPNGQKFPADLLFSVFRLEVLGIKFYDMQFNSILLDQDYNYVFVNFHQAVLDLRVNYCKVLFDDASNLILPKVWFSLAHEMLKLESPILLIEEEMKKRDPGARIDEFKRLTNLVNMYKNTYLKKTLKDVEKIMGYILFLFSRTYADYSEIIMNDVKYQMGVQVSSDLFYDSRFTEFDKTFGDIINRSIDTMAYKIYLFMYFFIQIEILSDIKLYDSENKELVKDIVYLSLGYFNFLYQDPISEDKVFVKNQDHTAADKVLLDIEKYVLARYKHIYNIMAIRDFRLIQEYMLYIITSLSVPNGIFGNMRVKPGEVVPETLMPFNVDKVLEHQAKRSSYRLKYLTDLREYYRLVSSLTYRYTNDVENRMKEEEKSNSGVTGFFRRIILSVREYVKGEPKITTENVRRYIYLSDFLELCKKPKGEWIAYILDSIDEIETFEPELGPMMKPLNKINIEDLR